MLRPCLALVLVFLSSLPSRAAAPAPSSQWIVVVAPAFREAIEPLVVHRQRQGLKVVVLTTTDVLSARDIHTGQASRLRDRVHQLCRPHAGPNHLLLVGAIHAFPPRLAEQTVVPPLPGSIGRMKDQPCDAAYGCVDSSRLPSVAVGRLPARNEAEARAMVAKILSLEKGLSLPGKWKRQLTVLAGIPAYNPVVDRLVESIAFARFDRIHPAWTGQAIYTNPQSRFCLPDRHLRSRTFENLRKGQAFVLYLGHSSAAGLYAGPTTPFLDRDDWSDLTVGAPGSLFITFGCNGCQLSGGDGEGYGVWAMRNPRGPAAVIGSHGICFASMVQLACDGLFQHAFQKQQAQRLGECWLAALRGVATGKIDYFSYRLLDAVDGDSKIPQGIQRQEHLEMFVLLGDPATRLPQVSEDIELQLDTRTIDPGQTLVVRGELPSRLLEGADKSPIKVVADLMRTAGSAPAAIEQVPATPGPLRDAVQLVNHRRANDFTLGRAETMVTGSGFSLRLKTPEKMPWPGVVLRVRASTPRSEALAVEMLKVARKDAPRP